MHTQADTYTCMTSIAEGVKNLSEWGGGKILHLRVCTRSPIIICKTRSELGIAIFGFTPFLGHIGWVVVGLVGGVVLYLLKQFIENFIEKLPKIPILPF